MSDQFVLKPALVRRIAETEIANLLESKRALLEQHSASFRWLTASLLAVNGGGIVALVGQLNMPRVYVAGSGFLFFLGIIMALLCAWFSQRANRAMLNPVAEFLGFWLSVAHEGELDLEALKTMEHKMAKATKVARPTQISGWLSAIAFSMGVLLAGTGYWVVHPSEISQAKPV